MTIDTSSPPDAKPEFISALINRLNAGDIKLPIFQREFVWKPGQIIDLLDSIWRGYPIGSLLFWRSDNIGLPAEKNIGGFELPETPDKYPRNYVLDGQQRITAIYGVMTYNGDATAESPFNVGFDLASRTFVPTSGDPSPSVLPMRAIFHQDVYFAFVNHLVSEGQHDLAELAERVWTAFREYLIPVVTIFEANIEEVAVIFERINSTGTRLTLFDLMVAATWSEDFLLRDEIQSTVEGLKQKDFEDISPVAVLQVLSALTDGSAKRETILNLRHHASSELTDGMAAVKSALERSVDFLSTELRVCSDDFLPYERQLVALAHALGKTPALTASQAQALRKWFWRTSFSERYRRGGEGLLDEDLENVVKAMSDAAVLLSFGRPPDAATLASAPFRKNSALTSAYAVFLATRGPRNLVNGTYIDTTKALSAYNRKEFHHIFAQAYLRSLSVPTERINSLANICMLSSEQNKSVGSRPPSEYVPELRDALGDDFDAVMASNLVPRETIPLLESDNYEAFLSARAAHIASLIEAEV